MDKEPDRNTERKAGKSILCKAFEIGNGIIAGIAIKQR
jgi:hypothetical protein